MTDDKADWTSIRIEAPLPTGVAGALMKLIGSAWPESVIVTDDHRRGYAIHMKVPPAKPEDLDQEFAEAIRAGAEADIGELGDSQFLGFRDGWVAFTPPEELCLHLGEVAHGIMTAHEPAAVNYVEWEIRTGKEPDDPKYQLSIARSKGQSPGVLWHKEKEETARLRALLEKHGVDPEEK